MFESYDLAHPARTRISFRKEEDLFDTLFPQPPPRSRVQAERLARPSLPLLRPVTQVDSADSSRSTTQHLSSSISIESVNSLSSYPSSTSSLSLLHSINPSKQGTADSSIDYYSPAISDVNSAETDHSASSGRTHSQSSELDGQEQRGPLTPLDLNGASQVWRPKELNLVRKRQVTTESSLPSHQVTPSWNATPTISADRNALLVGLGLGGVELNSSTSASAVPSGLPAENVLSEQRRALLRSRSPQLDTGAALFNAPLGAPQGPKQLLLVSSGGPPTSRRFPGRRPSEALLESFTSPLPPPPGSEHSSRCNTPQMRSAIPVLPSGPTFVDPRAQASDGSSILPAEKQTGLSAEEFLAQIASTPEYQASQYFESTATSSAWPSKVDRVGDGSAKPGKDLEKSLHTAKSHIVIDHTDDEGTIDNHPRTELIGSDSFAIVSTEDSALTARAPGFSRSASLSKRKAPPAPLVLATSPATSNSSTLPGSAGHGRRHSRDATVSAKSPPSAPLSDCSRTGLPTSGKFPISTASSSKGRRHDSVSDCSEPLRTAFYDFDSERDSDDENEDSESSCRSAQSPIVATLPAASTTDSSSGSSSFAHPLHSELRDSQLSAFGPPVDSSKGDAQSRDSSSSEALVAFEFADLETGSSDEGLSFQTMMGFLSRQDSHKAPPSPAADTNVEPKPDEHERRPRSETNATITAGQPSTKAAETDPDCPTSSVDVVRHKQADITPPASAAPGVPSFNISIFGPSQATESPPSFSFTPDPKVTVDDGDGAIAPESPARGSGRPRKQSMVPAPPSFAIRDASHGSSHSAEPFPLLPPISDDLEVHPVAVRADGNDTPTGNSRWSSGSESDGESAMTPKGGGRKSFSKGRKSFSTSRKNSIAIAREPMPTNGSFVPKEAVFDTGKKLSKRSSKTRTSAPEGAAASNSAPSKPSPATNTKRSLLNGLSTFRKKSFSNLSGQSAAPSTPSSARSNFLDRTEYPFPPSASPVLPTTTSQSPTPDHIEKPQLMIKTASAPTLTSAPQASILSPRMPTSAPFTASSNESGPLTTQQILAQARSNVWPDNYIGTGVSAAGLSSPYLSASQDTFSFEPSRLAPTPPLSAAASASKMGWSSAHFTPAMPQSPQTASSAMFQDKMLPMAPVDSAIGTPMSRSRTAEIAPPPRNLRHIRQSSSNTNLAKMRRDVPADVFKPTRIKAGDNGAVSSNAQLKTSAPSQHQESVKPGEERLTTIAESGLTNALTDMDGMTNEAQNLVDHARVPILVDRQQAKLQKARRIRKQGERFPRHNSLSDYGFQWVAEQGADAFDRLAAEPMPSSAILVAAGASSGRSNRIVTGGSGDGDGDDGSDESDTDDYGSSDGGGGAGGGGFGGAGGGGGGKRPGLGRNGTEGSDDEEDEVSDEEEEAEAMTDGSSDEDYGGVERSAAARAARGGAMPTVPVRNASMPSAQADAQDVQGSDSSDDQPLGLLVSDPKAVQKALRAQERKRHFALAAQALEGKGSSGSTPSNSNHTRDVRQASDAVLNSSDLTQRLAKVQGRRERALAPDAAAMQRSQTVARQDHGRGSEGRRQMDRAAVSRSKSVRTNPAERYVHPGLRARTPSEAALRAKAMAQGMPDRPSPTSPTLPGGTKLPDLPSNAMATVVAAQKAMAHAQANPTPAALAQAQVLASSATAALQAATAQVKRGTSSPVTPAFALGEPVGYVSSPPRIADGGELPGARNRAESRSHVMPVASAGGINGTSAAAATPHQPGMLQRLRSRSVSRNQAPLPINTAAAPPMPDLPRPNTASKDSQASSSPHSAHAPTFAALSQAAFHHGRPSVDTHSPNGDAHAHMQRAHSNRPGTLSSSHDSEFSTHAAPGEPRQPHKVFILSRQRFAVVEVPVSARARDLALEVVERERLPMDDSKGGWVVFDCSSELGIERPLREYEIITEVVNVRGHPKTDYFLIKRTELSPYLSMRSVPSSSPALAGFVYVQDRKKKWNKRWLELRDHGLYHAKNEKGKDEMSICQISSFDVYLVDSSAVKMPKANGFALRSQNPITMFEKPDQDYIHYFCLTDPAAHRDWVRATLNARSYMLRQEKAVLFQADSSSNDQGPASSGTATSGGLSRKNTSRRPNGRSAAAAGDDTSNIGAAGPAPSTPLIDSNAFAGPFAKGSLLADKAISDAKEALRGHAAAAPPIGAFNDLSLMERNNARTNEALRREEALERQRRLKAGGQPLVDLSRK